MHLWLAQVQQVQVQQVPQNKPSMWEKNLASMAKEP